MPRTRFTMAVLLVVAFAATVAGSASARTEAADAAAAPLKMPRWVVIGKQATPAAADILSDSLGTFDNGFQQDGSIKYLDPERFNFLPTIATDEKGRDESGQETESEAIDLDAVKTLTAPSAEQAIALAEGALADAQLDPLDGAARVTRTPVATPTSFQFEPSDIGRQMMDAFTVPIAMNVNYELRLGLKNTRLIGPGADVQISFDGDEAATNVHYSMWELRQGANVVIINAAQATKLAQTQYASQCGGGSLRGVRLQSELVYYAPPLSTNAKSVMPAYRFGGTASAGGEPVQLRELVVPASQSGLRVSVAASAQGREVTARAIVKGGQPPYSYSWESCTTQLPDGLTGASIKYGAGGRAPFNRETVIVHVTDANGLTMSASKSIVIIGGTPSPVRTLQAVGPLDVGAETVGTSQGLPGCLPDTTGFTSRMGIEGIPTQFLWTNFNAWERDFKDPSKPFGQDSSYADDVDATFYCGHANGDGFTFPGAQTDDFLHFNDAFWGNRDLEWLAIAACGPLQEVSSGLQWWQRWGPAFGGLHILLGYETVSSDVTGEGWDFANNLLGFFWWGSGMKVRDAWALMAIWNQPAGVRWAEMGVYGPGWVSNYNDYFWNEGPVGPDITSIWGYWRIEGAA